MGKNQLLEIARLERTLAGRIFREAEAVNEVDFYSVSLPGVGFRKTSSRALRDPARRRFAQGRDAPRSEQKIARPRQIRRAEKRDNRKQTVTVLGYRCGCGGPVSRSGFAAALCSCPCPVWRRPSARVRYTRVDHLRQLVRIAPPSDPASSGGVRDRTVKATAYGTQQDYRENTHGQIRWSPHRTIQAPQGSIAITGLRHEGFREFRFVGANDEGRAPRSSSRPAAEGARETFTTN